MSECTKLRHKSPGAARRWHDRKWPGTYRRAYWCEECGAWHITTTPIGATVTGQEAIRLR